MYSVDKTFYDREVSGAHLSVTRSGGEYHVTLDIDDGDGRALVELDIMTAMKAGNAVLEAARYAADAEDDERVKGALRAARQGEIDRTLAAEEAGE